MVWEALDGAGWVGEVATLRMTVALRLGVALAPAIATAGRAQFEPLPGRARRLGEKGHIDDHGVAWQQRVGPLDGRAAGPGCWRASVARMSLSLARTCSSRQLSRRAG